MTIETMLISLIRILSDGQQHLALGTASRYLDAARIVGRSLALQYALHLAELTVHLLDQAAHLGVAAGVVGYGTVGIGGQRYVQCREHATTAAKGTIQKMGMIQSIEIRFNINKRQINIFVYIWFRFYIGHTAKIVVFLILY